MTAQVRQRSDARDNRARILAVARAAFAADGLDVPMREIARRAEVGAATVHRHFPTKEALFAAAFAEPMALCSAVVERGLAEADPWLGFCHVIEELMRLHALDRGLSRTFTSRLPRAVERLRADRDRTVRLLLRLIADAKASGHLRPDLELEDVIVALMANEGIRAESPALRSAASRRFAALMVESFRARPGAAPLPPLARLS
ncbi:TetR/AcrR family transcriptional regulator [Dactylosporangium sp. CA-139114]|uniref:TetR/AcrR family transcriptional regulator n=1 Tax=Dactylosporangium sp. CA-139114 TaxID=3239931 RepID=UPI003D963B61